MYRNTRLSVFYHCAHLGTWEAVDREIMASLTASGLLQNTDVFVRNDCADPALYEFPTLDMLRGFAAFNDGFILYLHTKGVTKPIPSIDDWRACMLYWMVDRWKECATRLARGYDVVGISRIETPLVHFQGNFWWARAEYIRKLGNVRDIRFIKSVANQNERHKAEFWVLSQPGKFYQPYHHRLNPYVTRNPRANYVDRPF